MAKKTSPAGKVVKEASPGKKAGKAKSRPTSDLERQQKIQTALFEIADAASAVTDMQSFYKRLHEIVGRLMYAENFFIALYDEQTDLISWPYHADTKDKDDAFWSPLPLAAFPGATGWILRHGKTLADPDGSAQAAGDRGEINQVGTASEGIGIPLKNEGKTIGVLVVQSYSKEIKYTLQDLELLNFAAQHIATALTRARAIEETRQRNAELAIINSVQEGLASKLDMQSIYDLVGDKIRDVFDAQGVSISSYDPATNLLHFHYSIQEGERIKYDPMPLSDKGFRAHIFRTGQSLRLDDVEAQGVSYGLAKLKPANVTKAAKSDAPKSWLGVPLLVGGKVGGVVNLYNVDRTNAYSDSDVRLLETLANSMSVALENARLFDEVQHKNIEITEALDQQTATSGILRVIAESPTNIQPVLDAVAEYGARLSESVECAIFQVVSDNQMKLAAQAGPDRAYPIGSLFPLNHDSVAGSSILDKTIYHIPDILETGERYPLSKSIQTAYRSFLGVPLMREDQCIGIIFIRRPEVGPFSEKQINLVKTFADQAAIAIENVRLFDETQRLLKETEERNAELAVINSVQEGLASKLDMQAIYDLVGDKIQEIFDANTVVLVTFDLERNVLYRHYVIEKGQRFKIEPTPIPENWMYFIVRGRTMVIGDSQAYIRAVDPEFQPPAGELPKSTVTVPLVINHELRGAISLQNVDRFNAYNDSDARLLETLANSMSVALENARLFDETQRLLKETEERNAELAVINRVQEGLASKLDYHAIVDLVGDTIREIFNTQSLSIGRYDHASQMVDYSYVVQNGQRTYYEPMPFSGVAHHLIRTRQMLVVSENVKQKMDEIGSHWGDLEIPKTLVYVPLIAGETVTGVVAIYDYEREHAFSDSDIRLLQTLSNAMSVALENARLWEQEKMFRKALQRELEIGREIQAGFLPEALPIAEGWEIAASLISAREVAGDFYDAFELPDGNIGIVIADVCDKGVGAALFMTLFRSLIRVIANQEYFEQAEVSKQEHSVNERLKHTMNLTNNYIAETHEKSGMFATLFFGILDPRNGRLAYINGGHEPPLIIQAGEVRETLQKTGPAVGAIPNSNFDIHETQLEAGDIFFAFTDGVPDCLDPHGEFFGRERMMSVFQRTISSAHHLVEGLEAELNQHINGATRFDDITLVAMRRGL